ncbi:PIN-like domain-containing protein [Pseudomonas cerasi]|uniref:PIN-like domain-containing protein n=1 Tax=Pseudomonas cerasi TaxID=1583341 RepID=UPI001656212B|nr:PIN-like domain-containing protein [Pseudomonas cerasi]MBC8881745.1 GHKL domain-containing protein [Pseudomonas cerasi]
MDENKQIRSLLKTHRDLDEEEFDSMWERAIFIFDANVLLDLYRLPKSAKNELLSVLQNPEIKNRIWISFQGLLEFLNNRHDTIGDQKNKFEMVRSKLREAIAGYNGVFSTLTTELAKLKLRQRHSLIDPERFISPENIKGGIHFVNEFLENLNELEEKQSDVHHKDDTKEHVLDLFNGKVGHGFTKEEIRKIYDEGEDRYKNEIPPGYMDKKKTEFYTVLDIEYKCKFGDLLFWHEVIRKAQTEKLEYIILVTGDLKEDWWLEKRGKKLGPRKELLNEIYTKAPELKSFHMYDTSNFLRRVGERSTFNVSESTISETENLLTTDRNDFSREEWTVLADVLDMVTSELKDFTITRDYNFLKLPPVNISFFTMFNICFEIIENIKQHGTGKILSVSSSFHKGYLSIRFSNPSLMKSFSSMESNRSVTTDAWKERGSGLHMINSLLSAEDIDIKISYENEVFSLEILIPLSKLP